LTTILGSYPGSRGILYDLPHVVWDAPALIQARGLTNRVTIEVGNFFETVPRGGDAYLLSHVIRDWTDDQCLTILENCRHAMNPGGRLLIIEMVLPTGDTPHPAKMVDIMMLVGPGAQERTEQEYGIGEDAQGNGFTTQRRRDEFSRPESPALQLRRSGELTTGPCPCGNVQ